MPKQDTRRRSVGVQNVAPPSELAAGRAVTVSPSYTPETPAPDQFQQLAGILSQFEPTLSQYVSDQAAEKRKTDRAQGAADRMKQGDQPDVAATLRPEQTNSYQTGYMQMHGELAAKRRARELEQAYLTGDRDAVDVDGLIRGAVDEDLQGLDDKDFLAGYMPEMDRFSATLRDTHNKYQTEQLQAKTQSGLMERLMGEFEGLAKNPKAKPEDFLSAYRTNKQFGRDTFQFDYPRLDALSLEAASSVALRMGRPDLLDIFKQKNPDGTPGMYYNPKYTEAIDRAQRAAKAAQEQMTVKATEEAQYELFKRIEADIEAGTYSGKKYQPFLSGQHPLLSAEKLASYDQQFKVVQQYKRSVADATTAISSANPGSLALLQAVDPNFKKARDEAVDQMVARAQQEGPEAIERVYRTLAQTKQEIPHLKNLLAVASPTNPEAFAQAATAYESLKQHDAAWAAQHVDDAQALQFDMYFRMRGAGSSHEAAIQALREVGTGQELRDVSSRFRSAWARELKNSAMSDAGDWKNTDYVADWIEQTAETRLALGGIDDAGAVDYAVELFEARHQDVGGHAVYNGGTRLSEADVDSMHWFIDNVNQSLTAKKNPYVNKDQGVWLEASPLHPGVYFVRYERTGQAFDTVTLDEIRERFTRSNYDKLAEEWKRIRQPLDYLAP